MALAQCGPPKSEAVIKAENAFGTVGADARYHALVWQDYSFGMRHHSYIVGIEKAERDKIGVAFRTYDTGRLKPPNEAFDLSAIDEPQQTTKFERINNDIRAMFVSHVVAHRFDPDTAGMRTEFLYDAYAIEPSDPPTTYEDGWNAIAQMERYLKSDIENAKARGVPFTHLMFLSMGWNNDQVVAVSAYDAILSQISDAARTDVEVFRPLVIGLTWPSVWGGTSIVDTLNRIAHVGSYPAKANDSDEIGFLFANHIMNSTLPKLEQVDPSLQTVAIGHSMGARILSRAYFSGPMLRNEVRRTGQPPIIIGLQGAFSANRFRQDHQLIPPFRWVTVGEGGPYQSFQEDQARIALTWARGDIYNPLARFATGAAHVGGFAGNRIFKKDEIEPKITRFKGIPDTDLIAACQAADEDNDILYVDASEYIGEHSDVRNPEVGKLVWSLMQCW
ncbi:MAG: hypothetical protein AAGF71_08155 [Pseudomonadota bacterium]